MNREIIESFLDLFKRMTKSLENVAIAGIEHAGHHNTKNDIHDIDRSRIDVNHSGDINIDNDQSTVPELKHQYIMTSSDDAEHDDSVDDIQRFPEIHDWHVSDKSYLMNPFDMYYKQVFARSADKSIFKSVEYYAVFAPILAMYTVEFKRNSKNVATYANIDNIVKEFLTEDRLQRIRNCINEILSFDIRKHTTIEDCVASVIKSDINYNGNDLRPNSFEYLLKPKKQHK